ncbi:hypothetical protein [Angustibacter sp. Root456]|uniref:hypothetical protein n=1 Tax=Angustibacter sp. Root456 TaxID=1736539 RepID=UPI0006F600CA|nr:hypothetical protein [Angustibacter sp. Root456]KQX69748.1 hypothetical protein ASD06_01570 [Angustibacter sp. Root456]
MSDQVAGILTGRAVAVGGGHAPLLEPTDVIVRTGEAVAAVGDPGHGHTALALALAGRLAHEGSVDVDGDSRARHLQRAVALVDVPGVSEPDGALPVTTVVVEELATAGLSTRRSAVHDVLAELGLAQPPHRFDALDARTRVALLAGLAARRPDVRFLVVTLPERHGATPEAWLPPLHALAAKGLGVLVTVGLGTGRLIHLPAAEIGGAIIASKETA